MIRTARPWLRVGTRDDVRNPGALLAHGVGAVLQLATTAQLPGLVSKELAIEDATSLSSVTIRDGVDFICQQKVAGHSVLVCCSGGFSCSVAFAVAALREEEGISLSEALDTIREVHPDAQPHPLLWESLCTYYQDPAAGTTGSGNRHRRSHRRGERPTNG